MRAITYNSYGDIDKLQITELNSPKPGINDVIVKVVAISPNPVLFVLYKFAELLKFFLK